MEEGSMCGEYFTWSWRRALVCLVLVASTVAAPSARADKRSTNEPITVVGPEEEVRPKPVVQEEPFTGPEEVDPETNPDLADPGLGFAWWSCEYPYAACLLGASPDHEGREILKRITALRAELVDLRKQLRALEARLDVLNNLRSDPNIPDDEDSRLFEESQEVADKHEELSEELQKKSSELQQLLKEAELKSGDRAGILPGARNPMRKRCLKVFDVCYELWKLNPLNKEKAQRRR